MTKKELLKQLAEKTQMQQTQIDMVLTALAKTVTEKLSAGEELTLPGIAHLSLHARAERQGRNPQTGEAITIPAKTVVHVLPVKDLRDAVIDVPVTKPDETAQPG